MSEISHLATDKDIVSMWSEIINVIYLLIAGVVGGACTFWWNRKKYLLDKQKLEHEIASSRAKIEADKKSLRQQMITNNIAPMRQAWINEVRNKVSEFNHQSRMLRSKIYTNFGTGIKHSEEKLTRLNDEISSDFYRLNELSEILDLLLPFNIDSENRREEIAENLRESINETIKNCTQVLFLISKNEKDVKVMTSAINSIRTSVDKVNSSAKKLLLQEWRVTKSLKEIE
ncbi:hypothetical protein H7E95_03495 [Proteus mirabilis]|uniref:hypothetical protein n=1 Tax=Proteus mirabilis TaxID=584 RepID=UPI0016231F3E|nr:hypothetical protein [Proteus mirabilis]MBB6686987.1 hypothetical protein [Proteus mirabilis]MBI6505032.1 hypothetical protein [Proteus mirabilis]